MNPISGIVNLCKLGIENYNFMFQMAPAVCVCVYIMYTTYIP